MRATGQLTNARESSCNDHACLAYSTRSERDAAAAEWLLEGARLGQRLLIVTPDGDADWKLLGAIAARDPKISVDDVVRLTTDQAYDLSRPIDAKSQLAGYEELVGRAARDGFNGVRVFCDITPMIADPARRTRHAHWEHVADAWMAAGNPLAPLCAYDIAVVGDEPQGVMAVHPLRNGPDASRVSFGLYNGESGRVLEGEIDAFAVPALTEALTALPHGPVDLDISGLCFLGVRGAMALAHADASQLCLTGAPPIVRRVWRLLGLDMHMLSAEAVSDSMT